MDRGAWRATVHRVPRVHRVARVGHDQAHTYKKYKKHSSKNTLQKKKKTLQTARAMYGKQHISFYLILLSKQKNKEPPVLMGIHPQKMMQS